MILSSNVIQIILIVIWSLIFLVSIIIEFAFSNDLISGFASIAAIPSLIIAVVKGAQNAWWVASQFIIFFSLWLIMFLVFYRITKKLIAKRRSKKGNDIFIGKETYVLLPSFEENEFANENYGKVKINDQFFRTFSIKGEGIIEKDTLATVVYIRGNVLFIKRSDNKK